MLKGWCYIGIFSLFIFNTGFPCSGCDVSTDCGHEIYKSPKPLPGCEMMNVTVHNNTNFKFVIDSSYKASPALGTFSNFFVEPNSLKKFTVTGVKVDEANQDKIDTSIRLIAKYNDGGTYKNSGAQVTIILKKDSCNSASAQLSMSDLRCYYRNRYPDGFTGCTWGSCVIGAGCYDSDPASARTCDFTCINQTPDNACPNFYDRFISVKCNNAPSTLVTTAADASSVTTSGVYTVGVNNSVAYSTSSRFQCNQSSECGPGKVGDECHGGTSDYNQPATLEFTIYPSPIETLTIMFPFNAQSPIAKLMSTTIYSNLSPQNLGGLGSYYSMTPVAVTDTTLAFSTLCNSANCPQPS